MQQKRLTLVMVGALTLAPTIRARAAIIQTGDVVDSPTNKIVGDSGVGSYTVNGGSNVVLTTNLTFGNQSTGDGTGLITGAGTSLQITNAFFTVGVAGDANVTIADGASVSTTSSGTDGSVNVGTGVLTVTGADTNLTATGPRFWVGGAGTGTLNIEDGATVNALSQTFNGSIFYIGSGGAANGIVNVRSGATLDATTTAASNSLLVIGQDGSGELNIESGGRVLGEMVRINLFTSASSVGTINVTGTDSLLSSTTFVRVEAALAGATATLNVGDGAAVRAQTYFAIGDADTVNSYVGTAQAHITSGGSVAVGENCYLGLYGPGAMTVSDGSVTVGADLDLGTYDTGTLTLSDGATFDVGDDAYFAWDNGSGTATVTGAGTTLTVADRLWLGWGSTGAPAHATLDVGRGGLVQALTNNSSSGSGLALAVASDDAATLRFTIGDDGSGNIASGSIVTGAFFFGSGAATLELTVDPGVALNPGDAFTLVNYDSWDGNFFSNIGDDSLLTVGANTFLIDYNHDLGGGDLALTATVVPEPASLALLALGGLSLLRRRRQPPKPQSMMHQENL